VKDNKDGLRADNNSLNIHDQEMLVIESRLPIKWASRNNFDARGLHFFILERNVHDAAKQRLQKSIMRLKTLSHDKSRVSSGMIRSIGEYMPSQGSS
jgi:hypothetical protein